MSVTFAQGFSAAGVAAGISSVEGKKDLALVVNNGPLDAAAGVFTSNRFCAAPVQWSRKVVADGHVKAVILNSGGANACTGEEGMGYCKETAEEAAKVLGVPENAVLVASTGVIGMQLPMDRLKKGISLLKEAKGSTLEHGTAASKAIMTTDAFHKISHREVSLPGGVVRLVGMAKGAGMICPNMATMLSVVLCDAQVEAPVWQKMLRDAVDLTFNRVTVDGDTSTNDTLYGRANGASGVPASGGEAIKALSAALTSVLGDLAYMLVKDGEGASKVARIHVAGAASDADAERVARTVGHSQLVKTALYGRDANWGRIVAAVGRSGADFNPDDVVVTLCGVELFRKGQPTDLDFDALLEEPLKQRDLPIDIVLGSGSGSYTLLASDLGHEYVNVNADYRS